jgi:hypothetical protein
VAGTCEGGNEHSNSVQCGEVFDQLKLDSFSRRTPLQAVTDRVNYIRHYAHFRKASISFVMVVRPSVHIE